MTKIVFPLVLFALLCLQKPVLSKEQTVEKKFNVARYMGEWYEIASFPTIFQPKSYVNTKATYTLNKNGTINVLNESWNNGKRVSIQGLAYKADPKSDEAKLKVIFSFPPDAGDYWILFADSKYRRALVGHPSRNYLWILNRQPKMNKKVYNALVKKAKRQGYDVSRLHITPQSQPPPA